MIFIIIYRVVEILMKTWPVRESEISFHQGSPTRLMTLFIIFKIQESTKDAVSLVFKR